MDVETSLTACSIIEMYPDGHRPLPDCLVLAWHACGEPFLDAEATDVVTSLLEKTLASSAEVSVMTYPAGTPAAA
jgi:uncharacterized protein (UPF0261 family)